MVKLIFVIGQPLCKLLMRLGFFEIKPKYLPIRPADALFPYFLCGYATAICLLLQFIIWLFSGPIWLYLITLSLLIFVPLVNRLVLDWTLRQEFAVMTEEEKENCNKMIEEEKNKNIWFQQH